MYVLEGMYSSPSLSDFLATLRDMPQHTHTHTHTRDACLVCVCAFSYVLYVVFPSGIVLLSSW